MKRLHPYLIPALVLLCGACASDRDQHAVDDAAPPPKAAPPSPVTGAVSESEFKAMHDLRTDAPGALRGTTIAIDGTRAYLSLPPGAQAPLAGIVVIHEWWGLNDHVKHWADRLASDGYAALAVDLYGGVVATTREEAMQAMKAVDPAAAEKTLRRAHQFLVEDTRVRAPRTAVIGWCFGGAQSLRLGLAEPELDAVVMYYGHPLTDPQALATLRAPLLGIFGTRDQSIPPATVAQFDAALTQAGKEHKIHSYDAEHAFANPSNPRYDEKNSALAWEEVRAFLARQLR